MKTLFKDLNSVIQLLFLIAVCVFIYLNTTISQKQLEEVRLIRLSVDSCKINLKKINSNVSGIESELDEGIKLRSSKDIFGY